MSRTATRAARVTLLAVALLAGCRRPPEERPIDTGARDAARVFFEAIGRRDWGTAHAALNGDSRRTCSRDELARRGEVYLKRVGFDAFTARAPVCEERGDEATAHMVLTGAGHARREYKDAVIVRRRDGKWGVVLPVRFGGT
ncbi:hypothetical protein [Frigoriglobus tundricola]|uniref:DUF4878 domain-containing protein n=1 Tax=Frigoriglobus tundricola TaxID=2774151 RepID=A0A6M5Z201_9BACT|nr:hypothetical protein [Frigoriglobus tundricola]QJW99182.1 hypothetical protein FTUN_6782 [Frigoriglobus tundricola]